MNNKIKEYNKISTSSINHQYPKILLEFPNLIFIVYWINSVVQLRKWYIKKAIKTYFNLYKKKPFHLVDVGCGEAQYILPITKKFSKSKFTCIDKNKANIEFLEKFSHFNKSTNVHILKEDICNFQLPTRANFLMCIAVLQYIEDDTKALENIFNQCDNEAKLILYTSVNGRFILPFYKKIFNKYQHYETIQNRQRVYEVSEFKSKVLKAGFTIEKEQYTYGYYGILSNEITNSFYILIAHHNIFIKLLLGALFFTSLPVILLFMVIDFFSNKETGNGIMIVAVKKHNNF